MKRHFNSLKSLLPVAGFLLLATAVSCNKKEEPTETDATDVVNSVAVNSFALKANPDVLTNLDSVYFSIDLEHGVIFNADSLPKGTDVHALVANITYSSTVTSAQILLDGGTCDDDKIDYLENPNDSIDFTRKQVVLRLKSTDDLVCDYRIKVNVHKTAPDSLMWDKMSVADLPARLQNPVEQKSVMKGAEVYSVISESDGSLTLATCADLINGDWQSSPLAFDFTPRVSSLTVSGEKFYMLDAQGRLMTSADCREWEATSAVWTQILGDYSGSLLGLRSDASGAIFHTSWPQDPAHEMPVKSNFPVKGFSQLGVFSSVWAESPTAFLAGGITADGTVTGATWAYDGDRWAMVANRQLPPLSSLAIVPYFSFLQSTKGYWKQNEYSVWLAMGGVKPDGSLNRTVYISYDNGVNWDEAPQLLQLPDYIPALSAPDLIIGDELKSSNLSDAWARLPSPRLKGVKLSFTVSGDNLTWRCPYIHIFGGYDASGHLNSNIWRGVLARLSYPPLF